MDLAFKHLLEHYLELHSGVMIQELRTGMSMPQQRDRAEPMQARAFTGAWADVLSSVKAEVAALQGGWPRTGCRQQLQVFGACHLQTIAMHSQAQHAVGSAGSQRPC